LDRHEQALLGAAISDDRLFEVMYKSLRLPTTMGSLTINQLLKKNKGQICVKPDNKGGHEELLLRAKMIPLVQGYLFAALAFSRKVADFTKIKLVVLGDRDSEGSFFEETERCEQELTLYLDYFSQKGTELILAKFDPEYIPMIMVEDEEVKLKNRIESDEYNKKTSSGALSLARMYTQTIENKDERRLYLNLNNQIIKNFPSLEKSLKPEIAMMLNSYTNSLHPYEDQQSTFAAQMAQFNQALINILEMKK